MFSSSTQVHCHCINIVFWMDLWTIEYTSFIWDFALCLCCWFDDQVDVNDFTSLLQAHGFDLYLNGHAHTLTQYTVDYEGAYVTTGAGALVAITSASGEVEEVDEHVPKGPRAEAKVNGQDWPKSGQGHSYQTVSIRSFYNLPFHEDCLMHCVLFPCIMLS